MEWDWEFSARSIHEIRKSRGEWNGIGNFHQNRSIKSGNQEKNGTGLGIFGKIDP
jgi:hypothetical protein